MASGTVSFGLVSIPVKLFSTSEGSAGISFNWLHKECSSRLKQQYVCPKDGEQVGRDGMVKGYEFAKGQFVTFTEQEIKDLQENPNQAIEITEFLPAAEVDAVYFDRAYYLGPDKGADRAYRLLTEALAATGRIALAKYRARGKQYLVMLRPFKTGLVMQQLHYHHEVKAFDEVPVGDAEIKEPELELAKRIIEQGAAESFVPSNYRDDVHDRIRGLIDQKVAGQDVSFAPLEEPKAQIIDLMEALKASLARKDGRARAGSEDDGEAGGESSDEKSEPRPARRAARAGGTGRRAAKS